MHYLRLPISPKFLAHTSGRGVNAPKPPEELLPNELVGPPERPAICRWTTGILLVLGSATSG